MVSTSAPVTESTRASAVRVWSALLVVYIVWGSTYIGIAVMIESIPGLTGSGIRFFIAALAMAVIVAVTRGPRTLKISRREAGASALIGVMLLATGIGTASIVFDHIPTGIAALIIATIPLWVVIIRLISGDRPRPLTLVGVGVGLIGLAVILAPGGISAPATGPAADGTAIVAGSIALVCSTFLWALGSWLSPRLPTPSNTLVFTTYQMLVAGIVLMIAGAVSGERIDIANVTMSSWLGLLYLIVFGSLLAYTAFTWLVGHAPLSLVTTYAYVNPAVAVVLGVIVFGEVVSSDVVFGVVFVLGGVALVVSGERTRRQPIGLATKAGGT
jgi:drug/metabolite transporter (DMT)-like permease